MIEQLDEYRVPLMQSIEKDCRESFPTEAQAFTAAILIARDVFSIPSEEVRAHYKVSKDMMDRSGSLAHTYELLSDGQFFETVSNVSRQKIADTRKRMFHALEVSLRATMRAPQAERDMFTPDAGGGLDEDVTAFSEALEQGLGERAPVPKLPSPGRHLRI